MTHYEVRLDKWLWAARVFKTRSLAAEACTAGHVDVGGTTAKPGRGIHRGDVVAVRMEARLRVLHVIELSEQRRPASEACLLYEDRSLPAPEPSLVAPPADRERGAGRPSKRDARKLRQLRGR